MYDRSVCDDAHISVVVLVCYEGINIVPLPFTDQVVKGVVYAGGLVLLMVQALTTEFADDGHGSAGFGGWSTNIHIIFL